MKILLLFRTSFSLLPVLIGLFISSFLFSEPKMLFQVKKVQTENTNGAVDSNASVVLVKPESALITETKSSWSKKILQKVAYFNTKVFLLAKQYLQNPSPALLLLVLGIAFLYGVLHAAGPGHGKTVLSSYMLSRELPLGNGIAMAFGVALIHILVALIVVAILYIFLHGYRVSSFQDVTKILTLISASLILAIGLYFLIQSLREIFFHSHSHEEHTHDHAHSHDAHHGHNHHEHEHSHEVKARPELSKKSVAGMMFSIGIVPCPGPISILLFSIYAKAIYLGLLCALSMALGMGATYALAVITIKAFKKLTLKPGSGKWATRLHHAYELIGAGLILLVGSLILMSALSGAVV